MKKDLHHIVWDEQGSALLAVLVITLLITLLLGTVFAIYQLNVKKALRDTRSVQARYLAEAGIYKALGQYDIKELVDKEVIGIKLFESDTAFISAEAFGAYIKLNSRVNVKGQKGYVSVLAGRQPGKSFQNALLLGDRRSRFSIAGSASIKGDLKIGPQGMTRESFKGQRYTGSVQGKLHKTSDTILPEFNNSIIKRSMRNYDELIGSKSSRDSRPSVFHKLDSLQSRSRMPMTMSIDGDCTLSTNKIEKWHLKSASRIICTGKMKITDDLKLPPLCQLLAGDGIQIEAKIKGRQLVFYTPSEIWIGKNSRLTGQLLSRRKVTLADNAYLKYPSLVWVELQKLDQKKVIEISGHSKYEGTIIYNADRPKGSTKMLNKIFIGSATTIRGGIFNTHQTELHGKLMGTLLTHQFYFYESPSTYINWLKEGKINVTARSGNYLLPPGFSDAGRYDNIYWSRSKQVDAKIKRGEL